MRVYKLVDFKFSDKYFPYIVETNAPGIVFIFDEIKFKYFFNHDSKPIYMLIPTPREIECLGKLIGVF